MSLLPTTTLQQISPLLQPIIALNLWTFLMEGWMYLTRIPALNAAISSGKLDASPNMTVASMNAAIPAHIRWKADNYNHLLEQPMQFYAVAGVLVAVELAKANGGSAGVGGGDVDWVQVQLAWAYVAVRVVHSLVQAMTNIIMVRFSLFVMSSVVLFGMTVRAALTVF